MAEPEEAAPDVNAAYRRVRDWISPMSVGLSCCA